MTTAPSPSPRPVVLVTGSSRGLGREIALRFARAGWNAVLNCVRSAQAAENVAAQARSLGSDALVVLGDVADPATEDALVRAALDRWGRLDCLVNNAAIARDNLLAALPVSAWDEVIETDLLAPIRLTRRAAEVMSRGSSIVNVCSISGLWGAPGSAAYSAAKGALIGFTTGAAAELAARGIRINAVAPGYMPTDMGRAADDAMQVARSRHAMGRLADPSGAAEFIVRLTRRLHVTGQVFVLDGRIR